MYGYGYIGESLATPHINSQRQAELHGAALFKHRERNHLLGMAMDYRRTLLWKSNKNTFVGIPTARYLSRQAD
jgi:hypothetical protein